MAENQTEHFSEYDVKKIALVRVLEKIGLNKEETKEYLFLPDRGESQRATGFLRSMRKKLLADIHEKQKLLDLLDCMIHEARDPNK